MKSTSSDLRTAAGGTGRFRTRRPLTRLAAAVVATVASAGVGVTAAGAVPAGALGATTAYSAPTWSVTGGSAAPIGSAGQSKSGSTIHVTGAVGAVGSVRPVGAIRPVRSAGQVATAGIPGVLTECSEESYGGDRRLGPAVLPRLGRVGIELIGYHRTGSLPVEEFLERYWDAALNAGTGGWIYPPANGYRLRRDGSPIVWDQPLRPGRTIDRYGSEYGSFLSPGGSSYRSRAIPPSNLNGTPAATCNYRNYRVLKAFTVHAGPIAPWFAQPGGGLQYQLDAALLPGAPAALNVLWLVENGYLKRISG